ncbi:hypothetical protein BKA61DRAFT_586691 [Leptodontidium sp. MPI-SDFR-AT-0119]|nr:hypothetical protein BKA61DRAFT_586691 [Leptodontidium sp. MPI-SDFR-AT-0119]
MIICISQPPTSVLLFLNILFLSLIYPSLHIQSQSPTTRGSLRSVLLIYLNYNQVYTVYRTRLPLSTKYFCLFLPSTPSKTDGSGIGNGDNPMQREYCKPTTASHRISWLVGLHHPSPSPSPSRSRHVPIRKGFRYTGAEHWLDAVSDAD